MRKPWPHQSRPLRRALATVCAATVGGAGLVLAPPSAAVTAPAYSSTITLTAAKATSVRPGELTKGPKPQVLHLRKRTIHDGNRMLKIRLKPQNMRLLGKSRRGYVINRINPDHLLFVRPGRKPRRLTNFSLHGRVNDAGTRVAELENDRGDSTWTNSVAVPSGKRLCLGCYLPEFTSLVAFPGKRMIISSAYNNRTFWFDPGTRKRTSIAKEGTVAADPIHNRIIVYGDKNEPNFRLATFKNSDRTLGGWDRGRPLTFSPNGKLLLTRVGTSKIQVRSAKTGRLVRTYRAERIGPTVRFETNQKVLMTVTGHNVAANVRCNLTGKCVRTTRTEKKPGRLNLEWPTQQGA